MIEKGKKKNNSQFIDAKVRGTFHVYGTICFFKALEKKRPIFENY